MFFLPNGEGIKNLARPNLMFFTCYFPLFSRSKKKKKCYLKSISL